MPAGLLRLLVLEASYLSVVLISAYVISVILFSVAFDIPFDTRDFKENLNVFFFFFFFVFVLY